MSDETFVDLIPDELALARAQLASGLLGMAEGSLRRHVARLDASDRGVPEELDAARALLAEVLWRQGRPLAGGAVVDSIRAGSLERRRPIVLLVEAEAMAAGGDPDRAVALMERVIAAVGADEAWRLRGGVPSRLAWPVPASMRATQRRPASPTAVAAGTAAPPPSPERTAAAHARLEAGRHAYNAGNDDEGDRELGLALRLDPRVAAEGVALVEPTLGPRPGADRLLLYGDLLRAAGRSPEASEAYDRAARN
jgi:tetratricopeptide (TPR) repeat protein